MSLVTLLVNDTAHTGVELSLLPGQLAADGGYVHAFLWNDGYQRLSETALPVVAEQQVIDATEAAGQSVASTLPCRLEAIIPPCTELIAAVGFARRSIEAVPEEDFTAAALHQLDYFHAWALYNIAIARFNVALRDDFMTTKSDAVQRLGEVVALFEAIEKAPCAKGSASATAELTADNLRVRALLAAATAIEVRVAFLAKDIGADVEGFAAACHKASLLYRHVAVVAESSGYIVDAAAAANLAHIKRLTYEGYCLFAMSLAHGTTKGASRRRRAQAAFETALEWLLQMLPGARKQAEDELTFMVNQCSNFDRLQRKGHITLGNLGHRGRHEAGDQTVGAELVVKLADGDEELVEATALPRAANVVVAKPADDEDTEEKSTDVAEEVNVPPMTLECRTDDVNLVVGAAGLSKQQARAPYQFVECLVTLTGATERSLPAGSPMLPRAPTALALIFDLYSVEQPEGSVLRELLLFSVRSARLVPGDRVGVVFHDRTAMGTDAAPTSVWVTVDESGASMADVQDAITAVKAGGQFAGSAGTSIFPLVEKAQQDLQELDASMNRFAMVITDFSDRTAHSTAADVAAYQRLRSVPAAAAEAKEGEQADGEEGDGESASPKETVTPTSWKYDGIPVHTFVVGSIGQATLLHDMAARTGGNAGLYLRDGNEDADANRLSALRSWIVGVLNDACTQCARRIEVEVTAANSETFVHNAALAPLPPACRPASGAEPNRSNSATVNVPDLGLDQTSHVAVMFALQSSQCVSDVLALGSVVVRFVDPRGEARELRGTLTNVSCPELADRDLHPWLQQLRVACVQGRSTIVHPSLPQPTPARGSETLYALDTVLTKNPSSSRPGSAASGTAGQASPDDDAGQAAPSRVTLTAPEGLMVEVLPDSEVGIASAAVNDVALELKQGGMAIATASFGKARVIVASQLYTIVVRPASFVRVEIDSGAETVVVRVIRGEAAMELRGSAARGFDDSNGVVTLAAPKQTSARIGEPPASPWALAEDGLLGFTALSTSLAKRLSDLALMDVEQLRGVAAAQMGSLADRIRRRNRRGTLGHSTGSRRCRKFLVMNEADLAKQRFSSSLGYAVGHAGIDQVKRLMDEAISLSSPLVEHRRTWAAFVLASDLHQVLLRCRTYGCSDGFMTQRHREQVHVMLSARDRAAAQRAAEAAAKLKQAADAERNRRQAVISELLPVWDFSRRGVVSLADVQAVLFSLDCRRMRQIAQALSKWSALVEMFDAASGRRGDDAKLPLTVVPRSFSAEQLVAVVLYLAEHLDAPGFNAFADALHRTIHTTARAIEKSARSRTAFNLFQRLDTNHNGHVAWTDRCVRVLRYTFGDGHEAFARIEAFTEAAVKVFDDITPRDNTDPNEQSKHYHANDAAGLQLDDFELITVENIDNERITPLVFVTALAAFFDGVPDDRANRELAMLCDHAQHRAHMPQSIDYVVERQRKESERQHLLEWDLPHVFDGVVDSEIRKTIDPKWKAPDNVQAIAAPLCLLTGLAPLPDVTDAIDPVRPFNYWGALRTVLKRDARGFFALLKNFPPLSITHFQAQVIGAALKEKGFEASQLLRVSPVLAALCDWMRIILRIAFLEHEWEARPPVYAEVVRTIQAERNRMASLLIADQPAAPAPSGSPGRGAAATDTTAPVCDTAPTYARQFRPLYRPGAASEEDVKSTSRFPPAVASPRRPRSAMPQSESALKRPQSAALYGTPTPKGLPPASPSQQQQASQQTALTPVRPATARPGSTVRPASAQRRSAPAASAWAENGWEEPAGINPDAY